MKNTSRYLLILVLLLISWWLQNLFDRKPELITREKTRFANYYLEDFKLTAHDKQGKVKYTLQAERLDNYEQESVAEIVAVHTVLFNENSDWSISADKAKIFQGESKIEFYDNVKIIRPKQANQSAFTLLTDSMTLYSDRELLETTSPITIKNGAGTFESNGFSLDNKKGILELKSDVRGSYVN